MSIRRVKAGLGFSYVDADGRTIHRGIRKRIADLVIPPAWSEVRIAADASAHLQAVGRDEAGRLQYIYHDAWEDVRAQAKAERLRQLGLVLPDLRERVAHAIAAAELTREGAIAAAVRLIDVAVLRVGHEMYAGEESGRGAATLLKRHVRLADSTINLSFRGKAGKRIDKQLDDPLLRGAIERLRRFRGSRLFLDPTPPIKPLTAKDINSWLGEVTGAPVTAAISAPFMPRRWRSRPLPEAVRPGRAPRRGRPRRWRATSRWFSPIPRPSPARATSTPRS